MLVPSFGFVRRRVCVSYERTRVPGRTQGLQRRLRFSRGCSDGLFRILEDVRETRTSTLEKDDPSQATSPFFTVSWVRSSTITLIRHGERQRMGHESVGVNSKNR